MAVFNKNASGQAQGIGSVFVKTGTNTAAEISEIWNKNASGQAQLLWSGLGKLKAPIGLLFAHQRTQTDINPVVSTLNLSSWPSSITTTGIAAWNPPYINREYKTIILTRAISASSFQRYAFSYSNAVPSLDWSNGVAFGETLNASNTNGSVYSPRLWVTPDRVDGKAYTFRMTNTNGQYMETNNVIVYHRTGKKTFSQLYTVPTSHNPIDSGKTAVKDSKNAWISPWHVLNKSNGNVSAGIAAPESLWYGLQDNHLEGSAYDDTFWYYVREYSQIRRYQNQPGTEFMQPIASRTLAGNYILVGIYEYGEYIYISTFESSGSLLRLPKNLSAAATTITIPSGYVIYDMDRYNGLFAAWNSSTRTAAIINTSGTIINSVGLEKISNTTIYGRPFMRFI